MGSIQGAGLVQSNAVAVDQLGLSLIVLTSGQRQLTGYAAKDDLSSGGSMPVGCFCAHESPFCFCLRSWPVVAKQGLPPILVLTADRMHGWESTPVQSAAGMLVLTPTPVATRGPGTSK